MINSCASECLYLTTSCRHQPQHNTCVSIIFQVMHNAQCNWSPANFSESSFSAGGATVMDSTRMYSGEAPRLTISSSTCGICTRDIGTLLCDIAA